MSSTIELLRQALVDTEEMERAQQQADWEGFARIEQHRDTLLQEAYDHIPAADGAEADRLTRLLLKKNRELTRHCDRERERLGASLAHLSQGRKGVAAYERNLT